MQPISKYSLLSALCLVGGCGGAGQLTDYGEPSGVGQLAQALTTVDKGIILIDRTGSMMMPRANGHSRCADALKMAETAVNEFFYGYGGASVAVWTFNGASTVHLTSNYVSPTDAITAIKSLYPEGCNDVTPLADALCLAVDELGVYAAANPTAKYHLITETDGEENSSMGPCAGDSSALGNPSSWRSKVALRVMLKAPSANLKTTFGHFDQNELIMARKVDPETGKAIVHSDSDVAGRNLDYDTFLNLAESTDGVYDRMADYDTQYECTFGKCPAHYYAP